MLLTRNLTDSATPLLAEHHVAVITADDYLVRLLRLRPGAVTDAFLATAAARTNPAVSAADLVERVHNAGAPLFATAMGRRLMTP